ncbi:MAG TPA: RIP metalloprotease RseP [Pyrinomonadaceae bacterium]|nr:RIP metalloprotease RseP [Pyrinomonadaceae bacterium]
MSYLVGFLAFIFILGAAVVIHEFGHFIVAKLLKIRVETFSVGFGPRLFGRRWGTTDYRVSAIPLGGYVKLGGDESNAAIEGAGASDVPPEEQFNLRPRWQKISVAVAGPVMNILTALAIPFFGAMYAGVPVMPAPTVNLVRQGGAADAAGIKPGDRIISFNGKENPTWERIENDALLSPEQPLPLVIERDGQRVTTAIRPTKQMHDGNALGQLDMEPDYGALPVVIGMVEEGGPAKEAGLKAGDRIVAINGVPARNKEQVTQFIQDNKAEPIRLTIERGGERQEITARVRQMPDGRERLGFGYSREPLERVGPITAASYAVSKNIEILRLTGKALGQTFTGQRSIRDTLAGPIGIATESSKAANNYGWEGVFFMLAFMSLNLGVFNLLPIPVLDGGAIFLLLVEAMLGWVGLKLSMTMRERIQQIGFVVLLLLMGFVITNDLLKVASRWRVADDNRPAVTAPQK